MSCFFPRHLCFGFVLLLGASLAHATTWTVTGTSGTCLVSDPYCLTLASAITAASSNDTIVFSSAMQAPNVISETGLVVSKNLTIDGSPNGVILDGGYNATLRIVEVSSSIIATLTHLTLQHGGTTGTTEAGIALTNSGNLTLDHCTVTGNTSTSSAIRNSNGGSLTILYSSIRDNTSRGISNSVSGTLMIDHSLVAGNILTSGQGAGISNANIATISNSTVAFNQTTAAAGIYSSGSRLIVDHSTIAYNTATNSSFGAGIITSGTLYIYSSIVASNLGSSYPDIDNGGHYTAKGTIVSLGYNLIGDSTDSDIDGSVTGDQVDVSAQFADTTAPASNGGPTQTLSLLSVSPAIGVGNCASTTADTTPVATSSTDQRGYPHVLATPTCSIGAFEYDDLFFNGFETL